jgi:uncharacterized protein (TIGR03086 family)
MDAKELFKAAVKSAHGCISQVEPAQLGRATPCSKWNLRALLNHMVNELAWIPDLLAGKTIAEVGSKYDGDLLGNDAPAAWRLLLEHALAAVEIADLQATVHLSYGDFPAEHYIRESGTDILVHGWDVGQAIGCPVVFDEKLAQTVYDFVSPRAEEFKQSGLFGTPLPTRETDSTQTKLLAFFGRSTTSRLSG